MNQIANISDSLRKDINTVRRLLRLTGRTLLVGIVGIPLTLVAYLLLPNFWTLLLMAAAALGLGGLLATRSYVKDRLLQLEGTHSRQLALEEAELDRVIAADDDALAISLRIGKHE